MHRCALYTLVFRFVPIEPHFFQSFLKRLLALNKYGPLLSQRLKFSCAALWKRMRSFHATKCPRRHLRCPRMRAATGVEVCGDCGAVLTVVERTAQHMDRPLVDPSLYLGFEPVSQGCCCGGGEMLATLSDLTLRPPLRLISDPLKPATPRRCSSWLSLGRSGRSR